ncbi:MAG: hypothetical protein KGL39_27065 [Patescibacteria group bacterium]|nr:hypothetical protein [Patescibacteria group bacterium]
MARLKSIGFELDSNTAGVEVTTFNFIGTPTGLSNTFAHSGTWSEKFAPSAAQMATNYQYSSGTGISFIRAWIYLTAYPAANCSILDIGTASAAYGAIYMNTTGQLGINTGTSPGTYASVKSAAIPLNSWHYIELEMDCSIANTQIATGRLDGIFFDTQTGVQTESANSATLAAWGAGLRESASSIVIYFDDIAVNDNTGSYQTSWPGNGSLVYMRPNSTGDSNGFATQTGGTAGSANNYTRVNEITPDNATTMNASNTLNASDLFICGASGINNNSAINSVEVNLVLNNSVADATTAIKSQLEKVSGGTISQSVAIIPNTTTWQTNSTAPANPALVLYNDPDGLRWTRYTLDTMQIGYLLYATGTNSIQVTNIFAVVDYSSPNRNPYYNIGTRPHPFSPGLAR